MCGIWNSYPMMDRQWGWRICSVGILSNQKRKMTITALLDDMYRQIEKQGLQSFIRRIIPADIRSSRENRNCLPVLNRYREERRLSSD